MSERTLQDRVVDRAKRRGWKVAHAGRGWVGDAETGEGQFITPMSPGWPDLFMLNPRKAPYRLAIELKKRGRGRFARAAGRWLELLNACGIPAVVVRPSDLREGRVNAILEGNECPRCSICKQPDGPPYSWTRCWRQGVTAATISRQFEGIGASRQPRAASTATASTTRTTAPSPEGHAQDRSRGLVRDRAIEMFENEELDLRNKDHAPGITAGSRRRRSSRTARRKRPSPGAAKSWSSPCSPSWASAPPPSALDDGNTIEGEAVEVDGTPD
jgi:hypothetical protein